MLWLFPNSLIPNFHFYTFLNTGSAQRGAVVVPEPYCSARILHRAAQIWTRATIIK